LATVPDIQLYYISSQKSNFPLSAFFSA